MTQRRNGFCIAIIGRLLIKPKGKLFFLTNHLTLSASYMLPQCTVSSQPIKLIAFWVVQLLVKMIGHFLSKGSLISKGIFNLVSSFTNLRNHCSSEKWFHKLKSFQAIGFVSYLYYCSPYFIRNFAQKRKLVLSVHFLFSLYQNKLRIFLYKMFD